MHYSHRSQWREHDTVVIIIIALSLRICVADPDVSFGASGSGSIIITDLDPDPSILYQAKKVEKPLFLTVLRLRYDFLSLKTVPSKKSNKQNNIGKKLFCWHIESYRRKEQDPDPLVSSTDPWIQIRVRSKMTRIHDTATNDSYFLKICEVGLFRFRPAFYLIFFNISVIFNMSTIDKSN